MLTEYHRRMHRYWWLSIANSNMSKIITFLISPLIHLFWNLHLTNLFMWKRQFGSKIICFPHGDQSLGKHAVKVKMLHSYALKQWMQYYFLDEIYLRVSRHYVQIIAVSVGKFDGTFWETCSCSVFYVHWLVCVCVCVCGLRHIWLSSDCFCHENQVLWPGETWKRKKKRKIRLLLLLSRKL